jgi:MFS family permease
MQQTLFTISSLLFSIVILLVGNGMLTTLLSLRASEEGFSEGAIGVIMSMYFVGFIAGTFLCPKLIKRTGHIRSFAIVAAISSSSVMAYGLWVNQEAWMIFRFVTGLCMVGIYMVIESWLNTLSTNDIRGRVFAVYMLTNLTALALAQFLILAGKTTGFTLFAIASMLFSLSLVPVAFTRVPQPVEVTTIKLDLQHLYHTSPLGFMGCLTAGLVGSAFWALGPLFAEQSQLSRLGISIFMSSTIIGGAILQWPIGHWSDRADRRNILIVISLLSVIAALLALLIPEGLLPLLAISMFCYGGAMFSIYPVSVAHTNDHSALTDHVTTSSNLLLVNGIGAAIGPLAAGILMQFLGRDSLLYFFVAGGVGLSLFAHHEKRHGVVIPEEDKSDFVPLTRTTHAAIEAMAESEVEV